MNRFLLFFCAFIPFVLFCCPAQTVSEMKLPQSSYLGGSMQDNPNGSTITFFANGELGKWFSAGDVNVDFLHLGFGFGSQILLQEFPDGSGIHTRPRVGFGFGKIAFSLAEILFKWEKQHLYVIAGPTAMFPTGNYLNDTETHFKADDFLQKLYATIGIGMVTEESLFIEFRFQAVLKPAFYTTTTDYSRSQARFIATSVNHYIFTLLIGTNL